MWQRFCLCCQYTCRSGTRTIDLLKTLILILFSFVFSYFIFMLIGYAEYVSGFTWEMAGNPCGNIPALFYLCVVQGFLSVVLLFMCLAFFGLLGLGIYKLFKDPCMEIKDNWDRAQYPDYGTLDQKNNIEIVINTSTDTNDKI
jgi:hypothetical protein